MVVFLFAGLIVNMLSVIVTSNPASWSFVYIESVAFIITVFSPEDVFTTTVWLAHPVPKTSASVVCFSIPRKTFCCAIPVSELYTHPLASLNPIIEILSCVNLELAIPEAVPLTPVVFAVPLELRSEL